MQPNFRHLEMFRLLMKTRSLTETARLMRVSQPAISQALRELEGQVNLELFLRGGGRIRPTEEAVALLPEVERLFTQIGSLSARANELRDTRSGKISIASIPVLAISAAPQAIARFRDDRPRARISLQSLTTVEVLSLVKQGAVDLGFAVSPIDETMVGVEPLFQTGLCCLVPAGHPLAERSAITPGDLVGETVIGLSTLVPPGFILQEELLRRKLGDLITIDVNSASAALALVEADVGVAVVDPLPLLGNRGSNVVVRPFEPNMAITVSAVFSRHRPLPKIAVQFVHHMRAVLRDYAARLTEAGTPATGL